VDQGIEARLISGTKNAPDENWLGLVTSRLGGSIDFTYQEKENYHLQSPKKLLYKHPIQNLLEKILW
jgi:hypothetical protein